MKRHQLYMFDLDGTLIEGHVARPDPDGPFQQVRPFSEVVVLPGRVEKIEEVWGEGVSLAVCTNKAGVAFGHQSKQDCDDKRDAVLEQVFGLHYARWYEAYGHPQATEPFYRYDDVLRKPHPGMLYQAMADARVGPDEALFVGDMRVDKDAAYAAGVQFEWAADFFGDAARPRCLICGRPMNDDENCGGDCVDCMREVES